MSPPIDIDGSEIQGATIDGQDVSEITIDGQEAFSGIPDSGVLRYEFEQDVTDSFNNNDATDNTSAGYVSGKVGSFAKDFDGTDDHVVAPIEMSNFTSGGLSISAWVNIDSLTDNFTVMSSRRNGIENIFDVRGDDSISWFTEDSGGLNGFENSGVSVGTGTWRHLVAVYDPANGYSIYRDGIEQASSADTRFVSNSMDEQIGGGPDTRGFGDGAIDDLRFYEKSLSSTEISNLFNTGSISG